MVIERTPVTPLPIPNAQDLKQLARYDNKLRVRALIEIGIVRKLVQTLVAAGYTITVDDGEDRPVKRSTDEDAIVDAAFAVDECHLIAHNLNKDGVPQSGAILLVFGNSGYDVIADYATRLEEVLGPVNAYAEQLEGWM